MPPEFPPVKKHSSVSVPLAILGAGAMIAAAIYFGGVGPSLDKSPAQAAAATVDAISNGDHILGNPDSKIVVVEYSDLECPFCKAFHTTMHSIVDSYKGQVAWVFRQFPIAELHSKAPKEAEASECAAEQGGNSTFWSYIDKVFERTNSNNSLDPSELTNIAQELNLDMTKFNQCLSSGKYAKTIDDDVNKAIAAGARGTPYSVIFKNGKLVDGPSGTINGAAEYETVRSLIDSLLK